MRPAGIPVAAETAPHALILTIFPLTCSLKSCSLPPVSVFNFFRPFVMVSISVIVTCYNLEKYIEESLVSCFMQDYEGKMEIVIVDDASTDASAAVIRKTIEKYGKGRDIIFIQRPVNGGISAAMDTAMATAKHEWLVWADGDDIQMFDRCSKTARLIEENPYIHSLYLSREDIDANGIFRGAIRGPISVPYERHPVLYCQKTPEERLNNYKPGQHYQVSNYGCTMAIRKDLWKLWGAAVPDDYHGERFAQDPLWACRAYLTGAALASKEIGCKYRSHETNILNYHRDLLTLAGQKANELYMARYAANEAAFLKRALDDINRALECPSLTDWSPEQLHELRDILAIRMYIKQQCSYWWDKSIWQKLIVSLHIRKMIPKYMRLWMISRIFPLNVYCFAKMLRAKIKDRKLR